MPAPCDDDTDDRSECGNDGHTDDNNQDDNSAITGKHYTQHQFWNYVDDYLNFIHTRLFQNLTDPDARRSKVISYDILFLLW
jgi:hypothetical protein